MEVNEGLRYFGLVLDEMKFHVLLLALLQSLGCSGVPLYNSELEALANRGLGAALAEVNSVYAVNHLYRVTRGSVKRVIPVGMNTADLVMVFGIKETECVKASRNDPQTCAFRPGFFVPSLSCSSRVRMSATSTQVLSLRCGHDSSSSSESSEEKFSRGRHQFDLSFASRVPAPAPTPPPVQPGRSLHSLAAEVWTNSLE
ncbi:secreted phosphoprotein 24 [Sander lucioperca]|uniref:secreted phosphoprotein 24 n=1 Tax=Sander lucioperca TaxID=283035 RepID=UPI00125DF6A0|nr:secreted phosphoprotein 24 [Sander lucioperca]